MPSYETGRRKQFSRAWVIGSMLIFLAVELVLGGVIGRLIAGRFVGHVLRIKIEMLLMLAGYFLGGLFVGLFSPTVRILEPAVGAFLAVCVTFLYGFFTPYRFFGFSSNRLLIGGAIAFALALFGADLGERLAARFGNRESKKYLNE